ncbi:MAG: TlpA family protein disulfide reductase [Anaerolineae bacterium]|nr:TlpA family protein disulfide reductase [Anaerolineae bacterium]
MNEQIIKERHWTPWIMAGSGLIVSLVFGSLLFFSISWPDQTITSLATLPPASFISASPTAPATPLKILSLPPPTDTVILSLATPTPTPPGTNPPDAEPTATPGQPAAPDFSLKTLDGRQISLSQFRGKPVLINFWASWCAPCRLEMPELKRVYEVRQDEGLVVLAVNVTYLDSMQDVQRFGTKFGLTFPVLLDETGEVADNLYYVRGLPTSIFVDRAGLVAKIQLGPMTGVQLDEFVGEILKEGKTGG